MRKYTDIFPIRLKALIQAYGFSLAETASILNLSSRSIVFEWENKKKFPSGEKFKYDINGFWGVIGLAFRTF